MNITSPILPSLDTFNKYLAIAWHNKWLTNNGQLHQILEKRLCEKIRTTNLSLFNNGTVALLVGIKALRITGKVVTTPFTFPATIHSLVWNRIEPVFCDISETDYNIDVTKLENVITPDTTGILGVHVYGNPCAVEMIHEIAKIYGLRVIYDGAHAFGVEIDSKPITSYGDITMLSFHATKLFHTAEGGALGYADPELKSRIDYLKNFGIKNEEEVIFPGINGKMSEVHAALGLSVLELYEQEYENRATVFRKYTNLLENIPGVIPLRYNSNVTRASYQYFVVRIMPEEAGFNRDEIYRKMRSAGINVRKYFFPLASNYNCYHHLPSARPEILPVANKISQQMLALPFYGALTDSDLEKIVSFLKT